MEKGLGMKHLLVALLFLSPLLNVQAAEINAGFNHSAWDALLKKYVISTQDGLTTQVDYAGIAADRAKLKIGRAHV